MRYYADTSFLISLFLPETTSEKAFQAVAGIKSPLPLIPLTFLELRNALNFAIYCKRITESERNILWQKLNDQIKLGFFAPVALSTTDLHEKAKELSDRHTVVAATRSLDLLHVAAALLLNVKELLTFDMRQSKAAKAEGLKTCSL